MNEDPTAPQAKPPPTFSDFLEKLLLKIVIFGVILLAAFLALMTYLARTQPQNPVTPSSSPAPPTTVATAEPAITGVQLTIDFGDGSQLRFPNLPHSPGMSVVDAMNLTKGLKRPLTFESKGTGDMMLITSIGDLANEGGGTSARNWQYRINDKPGTVSAAIAKLNPGDRVLWVFKPYTPGSP
ncbi:MAG: DUF4430 domain-containing protein [Phycisphaerales bacterium]|nr:DUF4430 domain-containing protein [Phycisphaerales bacterium]